MSFPRPHPYQSGGIGRGALGSWFLPGVQLGLRFTRPPTRSQGLCEPERRERRGLGAAGGTGQDHYKGEGGAEEEAMSREGLSVWLVTCRGHWTSRQVVESVVDAVWSDSRGVEGAGTGTQEMLLRSSGARAGREGST